MNQKDENRRLLGIDCHIKRNHLKTAEKKLARFGKYTQHMQGRTIIYSRRACSKT